MSHIRPTQDLEGASPRLHAACRDWAEGLLGVSGAGSSDEVRRRFWTRVDECRLVPSEEVLAAFHYLGEAADDEVVAAIPVVFAEKETARLDREVDSFAKHMFDLDPKSRGARWEALHNQAEGLLEVSWRLDALVLGLELDLAAVDSEDEDVATLVNLLCGLFSARILERAVWRRRIRDQWKTDPKRLSKTAERLQDAYPQFAELDPPLIHELVKSTDLSRLNTSEPIRFKYRVVPSRRARKTRAAASESSPFSPLIWIFGVVFLSTIGRLFIQTNPSERPTPIPRPSVLDNEEVREAFRDLLERAKEDPPQHPAGTPRNPLPQTPPGTARGLDYVPLDVSSGMMNEPGDPSAGGETIDPLTAPIPGTSGAGQPPFEGNASGPLDFLKQPGADR